MSVLITGGTGYIGSHLARLLLASGEGKVILFDTLVNPEAVADIAHRVEVVQGSINDTFLLLQVLRDNAVDCVFHLGAVLLYPEINTDAIVHANVLGTYQVFEAARLAGVERVLWATSIAVHGLRDTGPTLELVDGDNLCPRPDTFYGVSKLFGEHIAGILGQRHDISLVALRLPSIYGLGRATRRGISGGSWDLYAALVEQAAAGGTLVTPPADHLLKWCYVKDCVAAFLHLYRVPRERLTRNIYDVPGDIRPVAEAVDFLRRRCPQATFSFGEAPSRQPPFFSARPLVEELGFKSAWTMEQGMVDYIEMLGAPPQAGSRG